MKLFITGATGYIGGSVAARLVAQGHSVRGLVRDRTKADLLVACGIEPVIGSLDDERVLAREAREADGVVNTANADHLPSLLAMLEALKGSGKPLVHTSGSSLIGDDARGNRLSEAIFDEETPFVVEAGKQARHALNGTVLAAAAQGVRTVIICPTLIYGEGRGLNPHSIQIPFLVEQARSHGVVRVVGQGLNRWSTVHIDDLADLYLLALEKAPAGSFYFAESGEASFTAIGEEISARLGLGRLESVPAEEAAKLWGPARAYYTYGSNSRVRAKRARRELGWTPCHESALAWIRHEMTL
ncbi:NAD-dependent epimerase/dehydratase family protein [Ramlibacter sp. 2FC]|uniref:NAD-dependent epimerase/dehydratase family protein n=1 Tax=Ramlibacter sp. 2FC TaxID=2502188 RepID=UPI0010F60D78|nr:NAD-dependent epimerase/dehydratase family protein [Ramlibacter sp. 2FC]